MTTTNRSRRTPAWWGGPAHVAFTVTVFVVLASLDNAAERLIPGMVKTVAAEFTVTEAAIGFMTGAVILVNALTAALWGYRGDRSDRKRLLFAGTVLWSGGTYLSGTATSFAALFAYQMVTAVGLGAIASIGFSVISDFISPRRRGLAMSFWGLSQGLGTVIGSLVGSQLGAADFARPLTLTALAGGLFALLYLVGFDAPRGHREPELQELFAAGGEYDYRIERDQLPELAARRTNLWLVLQGFTAQFAYGSLIWITFLFQEKVEAAGYGAETATRVGGLFAVVFQAGALFSIVAGLIGDRVQRRTLRGRALVSTVGILGAIPFFLLFFFLPMRGLRVTEGAGTVALVPEVLGQIVTNPWIAAIFLAGLAALALTSADSPNWFALIADVNLPEHRGTIYGVGNLSNGVGRAAGNALTAVAARAFERALAPPLNWAVGLAVFQLFFLPTGYCYYKAAQTSPGDIRAVREVLRLRARGDPG